MMEFDGIRWNSMEFDGIHDGRYDDLIRVFGKSFVDKLGSLK